MSAGCPGAGCADQGIIKKWADKYGITIDVVQVNDYVESINQYTAGGFDGCAMTNMDALTIPAVGGVDSTALIVGDFSNGNDGIVSKTAKSVAELKGESINLVELSVSHYLLARALESRRARREGRDGGQHLGRRHRLGVHRHRRQERGHLEPAAVGGRGRAGRHRAVQLLADPGRDHRPHGGEHRDAEANPNFGKALVGAWYETLSIMRRTDEAAKAARTAMAEASGTDLAGFDAQLKTTRMFWEAKEAVEFTQSPKLVETMDHVRTFSNSKGLMGGDMDAVGIGFPGGQTLGNADSIKLRFTDACMKLAADGAL